MLFQIVFSLIFILPLFGSLSVLIKVIRNELNKRKDPEQSMSNLKVVGISVLALTGLYIGLFLVWFIWLPNIQLPFWLRLFSFLIAAPYLFGVIGFSVALRKATEAGGSPAKMASHISSSVNEINE